MTEEVWTGEGPDAMDVHNENFYTTPQCKARSCIRDEKLTIFSEIPEQFGWTTCNSVTPNFRRLFRP
jgi:hypothetical protein